MANIRRSARLSKAEGGRRSSTRKTPVSKARLHSLVERDETPEAAHTSIDGVMATPTANRNLRDRAAHASVPRTPKTEPQPERGDMHPKTIHQSTSKRPDSGLKLGFADISTSTDLQNTPTKSTSGTRQASRQSMASTMPANFEFKFASESTLSDQARQLMESVRADAARIKAEMTAEKAKQSWEDDEATSTYSSPRKIATAKGKAGRFSDAHMAQFQKMDSIENHPSSFRARPGFAIATTQSLKRSPSKAGLDEPERPRTAGKSTPRRVQPTPQHRLASVSPLKTTSVTSERIENSAPAKRARRSELEDVSAARASAIPRGGQSSLYSPTKSSLARIGQSNVPVSPTKPSLLPRSNSVKSLRNTSHSHHEPQKSAISSSDSPSKISQSQSTRSKPLPPLPLESDHNLRRVQSAKNLPSLDSERSPSKLPTFAGLRSILRSGLKNKSSIVPGTPKRLNMLSPTVDSSKKVDFTPSVKSRHAVKLAADSPSPAKPRHDTPYQAVGPLGVPYDPRAYTIDSDGAYSNMDEEEEVVYPTLPSDPVSPGPVVHTFAAKAKQLNRRESTEFKSIFTDLHPNKRDAPATLTSVNTAINKTDPTIHAHRILRSPSNPSADPSPSTIRHVRSSGNHSLVQPFEDRINTVPHGLPGKKRRRESIAESDEKGDNVDIREKRRVNSIPNVPGAWNESLVTNEAGNDSENQYPGSIDEEGAKRGGKRARTVSMQPLAALGAKSPAADNVRPNSMSPVKKSRPNTAREMAAQNAKDRKSGRTGGGLSLSRLNVLSRPKKRG